MMTTALRIVPELVTDERLRAYAARCTCPSGFQRALRAHLGDFRDAP